MDCARLPACWGGASDGRIIIGKAHGDGVVFESLSDKLQSVFDRLSSKGKLTESDVNVAMREVRLALLEADVNYKVVKEFVDKVKERSIGAEVMQSLTPAQTVVKIVHEELIELLG